MGGWMRPPVENQRKDTSMRQTILRALLGCNVILTQLNGPIVYELDCSL